MIKISTENEIKSSSVYWEEWRLHREVEYLLHLLKLYTQMVRLCRKFIKAMVRGVLNHWPSKKLKQPATILKGLLLNAINK